MVTLALGTHVQYLFKPKGRLTWHYRRHVPVSVKAHYPQPHILKSLQTRDDVEAALTNRAKPRRRVQGVVCPKLMHNQTSPIGGVFNTFELYRNAINDQKRR